MSAAILYGGIAALDLVGGYFAAENIKETAKLNRDISEMNAEFAELDAYDSELDGISQQAKYQSVVDQTLNDQRLAFAVNDVDASFGTAADIVEETNFIATLNKMEIEKQAQEQAQGFKVQARQFRMGAALDFAMANQRASDTQFNSVLNAANTIASGVGKGAFGGGKSKGVHGYSRAKKV
jgi:hypothetical protein